MPPGEVIHTSTIKPPTLVDNIVRSMFSFHFLFAFIGMSAFWFTIIQPDTMLPEGAHGAGHGNSANRDPSVYKEDIITQVETLEPCMLLGQGKPDQAISEAMALIKAKPHDLRANMCAGNVLTQVGDKQEGYRYLKRAVALAPRSRFVRLYFADKLAANKLFGEAQQQYGLVMTAYPSWDKPRIAMARIHMERGEPERAADELKVAVDARPQDGALRKERGLALARAGKGTIGLEEYALGDSVETNTLGLPKDIKQIATTWGTLDRAIFQLEKDLEQRPDDSEVKVQLGRIYMYSGRLKEARDMLMDARKSDPNDVNLRRSLALCLQKLGESNIALSEFMISVSLEKAREKELSGQQ